MFIENSSFIQNGGDTKNYDIALKKGGMVILMSSVFIEVQALPELAEWY